MGDTHEAMPFIYHVAQQHCPHLFLVQLLCKGKDTDNGVTEYAQGTILRNAQAGAKLYGVKPGTRITRESLPTEVLQHKEREDLLKQQIMDRLENLKGQHARLGNDSGPLWHLHLDDDEKFTELLGKLLESRWNSPFSPGSIARVIKNFMNLPEKVTGVEVTLTRKFGLSSRHQQVVQITFEFDGNNAAKLTCPTGYLEGHGLPGTVMPSTLVTKF